MNSYPRRSAALSWILASLSAAVLCSCTDTRDPKPAQGEALKLVLIGLDAADWQIVNRLLQKGSLPHLNEIVQGGTFGSLATVTWKPRGGASLQWTSVATGQQPEKHGILSGYALRPDDSAYPGYRGPNQSGMRKVPALWNVLGEQGIRVGVAGWPATWPAEAVNGYLVSHYVKIRSMKFDYDATVKRKLQLTFTGTTYANPDLNQTHPPSFYDVLEPNIHEAESVDDAKIHSIFPTLKKTDRRIFFDIKWNYVANEIVVGTALSLLQDPSLNFVAFIQHGIDVAFHRAHHLLSWEPFALEPHAEWFGLMEEYYAYTDESLGHALAVIPQDTVVMVVSEHGTVGGRHSLQAIDGILAVRGPGIKQGFKLEGASVLDVFPTLLYIYGLPIPQDLDGKVLKDLFTEEFQRSRIVTYVESYQDSEPPVALRRDFTRFNDEIMKRLDRIGYTKSQ